MSNRRIGAYGFTLREMDDASDWLTTAPEDWPAVTVRQAVGSPSTETWINEDEAVICLIGGRSAHLRRAEPEIRFVGPDALSNHALIHPYLAPAASVLASWQGWITFHAGAFEVDGRAWILAADRNGGKSTTLAGLSRSGFRILSDDLVVLRGEYALAGPRSLDLREGGEFGDAEDLGVVGERRRWRLRLRSVSPEIPVAGVIVLTWAKEPQIRVVATEKKAKILRPHLSMGAGRREMLRVLSLPVVELQRPRGPIENTIDLVERFVL